uniref:Murine leukemia virus integrase C-terminal domain-containing protein n=1 Tax=Molossus molossus TaxID=27622 RepID=A0A7J8BJK8_MOLMO|nr:hypothetical protein HJG59_010441 [Molossus molossus]
MRAIAATALLLKEVQKLTLGQDLQIIGGHTTEALLRSPDRWISNARLTQYQSLQAIEVIRREARLSAKERKQPTEAEPPPLDIEPGDWIWIKKFNKETLEPTWDGPHLVILTTPTAFKVSNKRPWIHHTQVKKAHPDQIPKKWVLFKDPTDPLKLKFTASS